MIVTQFEAVSTPESEAWQIQELHKLLELGPPALIGPNSSDRIDLPSSVYRILRTVVSNLKRGKSVLLIPDDEQLTTQMAADFLGVSRPHFVKLLEAGTLPFTKTGTHRRVLLRDVNVYAKSRDAERSAIINQMARDAFEEGSYHGIPIPDGGEDE